LVITKIEGMPSRTAELDVEKFAQKVRNSGCFALREVARAVTRMYDQVLAPTGLRVTEVGILRVCAAAGSISVAALARELATDRAFITRGIKPLIAAGMLRRIRPASGKEKVLVELTPQGQTALAEAIVRWDQAQRHLISRFGEAHWSWLKSRVSSIVGSDAE
jgi:DNA-binding MarR family transcriptional regulator